MTTIRPAPVTLSKPDAVRFLAAQAGMAEVHPYGEQVPALLERLPRPANPGVSLVPAEDLPGARLRRIMPDLHRPIPVPVFTNGRPACFPERSGFEDSPALEALEVEGGVLAQISRAPVVLDPAGQAAARDFSSPYAGLIHGFDFDLRALVAGAQRVAGTAIVLCDDIHPLNYSHWILDQLPRLACLGERRDAVVITGEEDRAFKRDTLALCGFRPSQVIHLQDFHAVRADRLLVPRGILSIPHPAFKAAPWALDFLRARIGFPALTGQPAAEQPYRLFISRDDTLGRRIVNEDEALRLLGPLGYRRVTLEGLSVARQVALFAGASHVVGAHGSGLANCAFAAPGARLLELFPGSYGTPAFYVIAAGQGNPYATYIAHDVVSGPIRQLDDFRLDVADFRRCCAGLL